MPSPASRTATPVLSDGPQLVRPSPAPLHTQRIPEGQQPRQISQRAELGPEPTSAGLHPCSQLGAFSCVLIFEADAQVLGFGVSAVRVGNTQLCKLQGDVNQPRKQFTKDVSNAHCGTVGRN